MYHTQECKALFLKAGGYSFPAPADLHLASHMEEAHLVFLPLLNHHSLLLLSIPHFTSPHLTVLARLKGAEKRANTTPSIM